MIKLLFLGCLLGASTAQFNRFGFGSRRDSIEDDSDERFFGSSRNFSPRTSFNSVRGNNFGFGRNFDSPEIDDDSDERRSFGRNQNFLRRRFNDSPERNVGHGSSFIRRDFDDSRDRDFSVSRNFFGRNSIIDSPEDFFGARRQTSFGRRDFDDSRERNFGSNRNFIRRDFDDSFENTFGNRRRTSFGRRDFDDDSDERFFSRTNSFNRNNNFGRTHQTVGQNFGTTQSARRPNFFTRQSFGTSTRGGTNNHLLLDSPEDLIDDLFDDDLDDRIRAQNALSHFQSPGTRTSSARTNTNSFGFGTSRKLPNNNFGTTGSRTNNGGFAFRSSVGRNRSPPARISTSSRRPFNQARKSVTTNTLQQQQVQQTPKQPPKRLTVNSIRAQEAKPAAVNRFSNRQNQPSRTPRVFRNNNFNWPGGNGYFVSMRTGTGKPTSYFVKFDD